MYNKKQKVASIILALASLATLKSCTSAKTFKNSEDEENIISSSQPSLEKYLTLDGVLPLNGTNIKYEKLSLDEFKSLPIYEQHNYILNYYNLNYIDLINAVSSTMEGARLPLSKTAKSLKERKDFEEIKEFFMALKSAKEILVKNEYSLTDEQFDSVFGYVAAYGVENYDEGYINMNLIDNCRYSNTYMDQVQEHYGEDACRSWYYYVELPNAFGVSPEREDFYTYKDSCPAYYGGLDYAVYKKSLHNFVNFRIWTSNPVYEYHINAGIQLVKNGNVYFNELTEDEIAKKEELENGKTRELKK